MNIIKAGQKFNRLTAIKFVKKDKLFKQYWLFRCSCGTEKVICVNSVKSDGTKSCGCLKRDHCGKNTAKHKMSYKPIHYVWRSMKQRCLNKNNKDYKNYGGRGIKICNRWLESFINFYKDMGDKPKNLSLDRINNNKNYCPENCRWATSKQQNNNKRNVKNDKAKK